MLNQAFERVGLQLGANVKRANAPAQVIDVAVIAFILTSATHTKGGHNLTRMVSSGLGGI